MITLPWWAYSPSPFTFVFWFLLALYGCRKLKPKTLKEWVSAFSISAFVVGLVVLPFDILWTVHQALTFGHLHPLDLAELLPLFNVKLVIWVVCVYESINLFGTTGKLRTENMFFLILYVPLLLVWFSLAPDPSWTDWTYALRFGFDSNRVVEAFLISHGFAKFVQAVIFVKLWW